MADSSLTHGFHAYSAWRAALRDRRQELLVAERGIRVQIEALAKITATLHAHLASAQISLAQSA